MLGHGACIGKHIHHFFRSAQFNCFGKNKHDVINVQLRINISGFLGINQKIESTQHLSMEFVADLYHPDAGELLTFFNQVIEQSMQFMRNFLIDAQKAGDIDTQLNIDYIMFILSKTIELCGTKEMMDMFPNASTMTKQISQTFIFGIAPLNKK